VLKSGSLNLLEFSGPVQACNGIALPSTFYQGIMVQLPTTATDDLLQNIRAAPGAHQAERVPRGSFPSGKTAGT